MRAFTHEKRWNRQDLIGNVRSSKHAHKLLFFKFQIKKIELENNF